MEEVGKFLERHNDQLCLEDSKLEELIEQLESIGVNKLEDLGFLRKGNLKGMRSEQNGFQTYLYLSGVCQSAKG